MSSSVDGLMHELRPQGDGLDRQRIAAEVSGVLFGHTPVVSIGRFVVEARLGVGGMGIVYRGYDPKLNRRVAIKVLDLRRVSANPAVTHKRLMAEAQALAQLSHPNVVSVHDVESLEDYREDARLYLVMEYVDGPTLRQWLKEERPLAERIELLLGAGRGLAAAHAAGLVHGDFKPENILVGADERARVADFGLALPILELDGASIHDSREPLLFGDAQGPDDTIRFEPDTSDITLSGVFGTPAYIAPEQFLRARVDARADQFSFCVVACEVLLGRRPFEGTGIEALAKAALAGEFVDLDAHDVPRSVRAALKRGLAADPAHRFATMDELLARLRAGFAPRRGRRRSLVAAATAGATAAGLWFALSAPAATDPTPKCDSAEDRLAPVWTQARAETITARLRDATPRGSEAATILVDRIDDQVQRWGTAWTRNCTSPADETTQQRTEACLDARLVELRGLVDALADPTAELQAPLALLDRLQPVRACAETERLDAARPVPLEASLRVQVDAVRNDLLTPAELATTLGRQQAVSLAEQGVTRAHTLGYRPLVAEAELVLGLALWAADRRDEAIETVEAAHLSAQASRHAYVLAEAATTRTTMAYESADLETGRVWLARAEAANDAAGGEPRLSVRLRVATCAAALRDGDFPLAVEECERGQALIDSGAQVDAHQRAALLTNLGIAETTSGLFARAEVSFRSATEAAALDLAGHDAVMHAIDLHSGHMAYERGDYEQAIYRYRVALQRLESAGTQPAGRKTPALVSIASALQALDRLDEAEVAYDEVLELAISIDDHWTIRQVRNEQGWLLLSRGQTQAAYEAWTQQRGPAREQLGADHPLVLELDNNIGEAQALLGEVDEGLAKMGEVIATVEQIYGPDHAELAIYLPVRASVAAKVGRWQTCVDDYDRTLAIESRRLDAHSQIVTRLKVERAECQLALGADPNTLIPELEEAVATLAAGPKRDAEAYARLELARAYLQVGDAQALAQLQLAQPLLEAGQADATDALATIETLRAEAERLTTPSP